MTDISTTMPDLGGLTCKEMVELVTDYLDGALPSDMRARFDQHLKGVAQPLLDGPSPENPEVSVRLP